MYSYRDRYSKQRREVVRSEMAKLIKVKSGIKVTVIVFTEETWLPEAILFVSASTTWM